MVFGSACWAIHDLMRPRGQSRAKSRQEALHSKCFVQLPHCGLERAGLYQVTEPWVQCMVDAYMGGIGPLIL